MIYLASPYSDPDQDVQDARRSAVCTVAGRLMMYGAHVFSPIAHGCAVSAHSALPDDFTFWESQCKRMLLKADQMWIAMIDGWDKSNGVKAETEFAQFLSIPVCLLDPISLEDKPIGEASEEWINS